MQYDFKMETRRSNCPISCSLEVFGDRWSLLIIRDIMLRDKVSFSEFLNSEEKIATNILVNRLKILEAEKIVVKEVSPENKSKYVYSLTQKGLDLLPIIIEIMDWGAKYNKNCPRRTLGKKIKENKAKVVKELSQSLQSKVK